MRAMQAQIKALDKEIERQFENIPNTLTSIKGIGPVFSAGIIAEVGDDTALPKDKPALRSMPVLFGKSINPAPLKGRIPA